MAVSTDKPCINNTVLELADKAPIGYVLYYTEGNYQWVDPKTIDIPEAKWKLTKTDRGFEMIDERGLSRGIINLGNPYSGINPTPACDDCGKDYIFQDSVLCIPQVCETSVFGNGDKGHKPEWIIPLTPEEKFQKPNYLRLQAIEWDNGSGEWILPYSVYAALQLEGEYNDNGEDWQPYDEIRKPREIIVEVFVDGQVVESESNANFNEITNSAGKVVSYAVNFNSYIPAIGNPYDPVNPYDPYIYTEAYCVYEEGQSERVRYNLTNPRGSSDTVTVGVK